MLVVEALFDTRHEFAHHFGLALCDLGIVKCHIFGSNTVLCGVLSVVVLFGTIEQGFGRDTTHIEACTAKGGLFKAAKVSYQAETETFVKIDSRAITEINTNAKKAKVMSVHPEGTYEFVENDGEMILNITNPDKFWQQTKYLVIQVM